MSTRITNSDELVKHRSVLLEASKLNGAELRNKFFSNLDEMFKSIKDTPVISVELAGKTFQFDKTITRVSNDEQSAELKGLRESLRVAEPGSVHGNFKIGDMPIPCGVVLIVGAANTAKTPLATAIGAHNGDFAYIRHGEPLAGYVSSNATLAQEIAANVLTYPGISTVVLDSFKDQLITTPGAAMASGLSRLIWPMLSDLSSTFSEAGKTLVVPINPATVTEGVLDMVVESAKSNVAMVVASQGHNNWVTTTRMGEGLQRSNHSFSVSFNKDGMLEINGAKEKGKKGRNGGVQTLGAISDADFDAVLRRNFNHLKED